MATKQGVARCAHPDLHDKPTRSRGDVKKNIPPPGIKAENSTTALKDIAEATGDIRDSVNNRRVVPQVASQQPLYQPQQNMSSSGVVNVNAGIGIRKTRKSCTFCAKRKKRCDGDGVSRCSLCREKNQAVCHYEIRASSKPKKPALAPAPTEQNAEQASKKRPGPVPSGDATNAGTGVRFSSLKRCRLTASPATGLVGTQENVYLTDYFACMGILPLVSEREIRQAMVSIMFAANVQQQRESGLDENAGREDLIRAMRNQPCPFGGVGKKADEEEGIWGDMVTDDMPNDPRTCMLWCAIAIGALVRGPPTDIVNRYVQRARQALAGCFDEGTLETARAHIIMAFLHNFLGEKVKHHKYVGFAKNIVNALPPEQVPSGVVELLKSEEKARLFYSRQVTPDELDSYCQDVQSIPEVFALEDTEELASFVIRADRRRCEAFLKDMLQQGGFMCKKDYYDDAGGARTGGVFSERGRRIPADLFRVLNGKDPEPPAPSEASKRLAKQLAPEMERLVVVAEKADLCQGFGGLIFYTNLSYLRLVHNDLVGCMLSMRRCAEILLRFPGLIRYTTWVHLAHCVLSVLATTNNEVMYEQVRKAYNNIRPEGCLSAPPLGEWAGMAQICDFLVCRSIKLTMGKFTSLRQPGRPGTTSSTESNPECVHGASCSEEDSLPTLSDVLTTNKDSVRDSITLSRDTSAVSSTSNSCPTSPEAEEGQDDADSDNGSRQSSSFAAWITEGLRDFGGLVAPSEPWEVDEASESCEQGSSELERTAFGADAPFAHRSAVSPSSDSGEMQDVESNEANEPYGIGPGVKHFWKSAFQIEPEVAEEHKAPAGVATSHETNGTLMSRCASLSTEQPILRPFTVSTGSLCCPMLDGDASMVTSGGDCCRVGGGCGRNILRDVGAGSKYDIVRNREYDPTGSLLSTVGQTQSTSTAVLSVTGVQDMDTCMSERVSRECPSSTATMEGQRPSGTVNGFGGVCGEVTSTIEFRQGSRQDSFRVGVEKAGGGGLPCSDVMKLLVEGSGGQADVDSGASGSWVEDAAPLSDVWLSEDLLDAAFGSAGEAGDDCGSREDGLPSFLQGLGLNWSASIESTQPPSELF